MGVQHLTICVALQVKKTPLHVRSLWRREAAKSSALGHNAVAGHHDGKTVSGHAIPDGASGAGRTRTSGKLRVCRHGAINDLATPPNHGPLKRREVRHIHLRVTKVDRYATGIVLQVPAQTGVPD